MADVHPRYSYPVKMVVQGWSSVFPRFSAVDFVSLYLEYDPSLSSLILLLMRDM